VKASGIKDSGLGPALHLITAADLHPMTTWNCIFKYVDDAFLVVTDSAVAQHYINGDASSQWEG